MRPHEILFEICQNIQSSETLKELFWFQKTIFEPKLAFIALYFGMKFRKLFASQVSSITDGIDIRHH